MKQINQVDAKTNGSDEEKNLPPEPFFTLCCWMLSMHSL